MRSIPTYVRCTAAAPASNEGAWCPSSVKCSTLRGRIAGEEEDKEATLPLALAMLLLESAAIRDGVSICKASIGRSLASVSPSNEGEAKVVAALWLCELAAKPRPIIMRTRASASFLEMRLLRRKYAMIAAQHTTELCITVNIPLPAIPRPIIPIVVPVKSAQIISAIVPRKPSCLHSC